MESRSYETDEGMDNDNDEDVEEEEEQDDDDDDDDDDDSEMNDDDDDGEETVSQPVADDGDDGGTAPTDAAAADVAPTGDGNNINAAAASDSQLIITAGPDLKSMEGLRELGSSEAVCWQLSSAKPGNGVEQVRAGSSLETYWQSDGQAQPHWIQVHFARRVAISHVCLYLDYQLDESYTPKRIIVHAGMTHQDLQEAVPAVELPEPSGWCILPLRSPPDPMDDYDDHHEDDDDNEKQRQNNDDDDQDSSLVWTNSRRRSLYNNKNIVRAHLIRISIQAMHQNGRDTHVRQVRLYGPRSNHDTYKNENALFGMNARRESSINGGSTNNDNLRRMDDDAWNLDMFGGGSGLGLTSLPSIR